ncbi:MAG TPA: Gfo/Idh/MocA family oxidoreductase [Terriglobia bacterium]|nr:Gfo/Idh/MocA family oxidoreductase [Terriglobia bacterium]
MSEEINRRDFMKRTTLATVGTSIAMTGMSRRVLGANDRVVIGLIGAGRQGTGNMRAFIHHGCEVASVCDVYQPNLDKGLQAAGANAKGVKDFRQVLDNKDIDSVIIGTPDHWHALPMVEACKAGKDVYVEKPISVVVDEGKKMVEAARKYKRVVQVGTWQRSNLHFQKAVEVVQSGVLGKVGFAKTWNYSNTYPDGIGAPADSDPPAGLDWDLWLGPAPMVHFNQNRFGVDNTKWSTFRYFYDYANGWLGDWCIHLLDIVHWAMKVDGPTAITASGSKFFLKDNSDTPDILQVTFEYPDFICTYENRLLNQNSMYDHGYGIEFHGTDGTMFVDRSGFKVFPEKKAYRGEKAGLSMQMDEVDDGLANHVANFLECLKTRNRPASDIEIGHRTSSACLLANVALRSKERIGWDVANQHITQGSPEAKKLLSREYRAPWKLVV